MKFNPKKDISPKYLFLALSVICIILLGLSLFSDSLVLKLKETFGNFIAPMQEGVSGIGEWVEDRFLVFGDVKELRKENDTLKKRNEELVLTQKWEIFNPLSEYYIPYAAGVKSGYTSTAGFCYVGAYQENGITLIAAVMGGQGRNMAWTDLKRLFAYGMAKTMNH